LLKWFQLKKKKDGREKDKKRLLVFLNYVFHAIKKESQHALNQVELQLKAD
jgi:hypothetical protein